MVARNSPVRGLIEQALDGVADEATALAVAVALRDPRLASQLRLVANASPAMRDALLPVIREVAHGAAANDP